MLCYIRRITGVSYALTTDVTVSMHGDDRSPSFFLIGVIHGVLNLMMCFLNKFLKQLDS
jgi:hypothetical protein